jgi:carbon monoxide dehydrogenase subunit G
MNKATASIVINKPIKEVFEYMASPYNGPAFIPNLSENTNIFPEKTGVGQKFDWRFNMLGVDLRGKAEVTEYAPPNKVVIVSSGDAKSTWIYTLEEIDETTTKVSVEIDYEFDETILQRLTNRALINKIAQKTAEQMVDNLKTILEF